MTLSKAITPMPSAKQLYVGAVRAVHPVARATGLLSWLQSSAKKHRLAHWLRSLFAIHDIDGLIDLDVPWWTYGAIDETEAFLASRPNARVFEYGSGASTVWLAKRAGTVVSVEHDAGWHSLVHTRLAEANGATSLSHALIEPSKAQAETDPQYLSVKPGHIGLSFENYSKSILDQDEAFDLIVIDGRARAACLEHAVTRLKPNGLIVFDNSRRKRYRQSIAGSGLVVRHLAGLTPSLPYPDETTLLTFPLKSAAKT
ncbi:class I SAM-dependent methyltransferase [uncultured Roseibium sp.]|uniref:class I SAM-dependent methyltransferase n=1 Tax=uncultured Roseibium sp. TaxID=1936171 RepID=UPI0026159B8E|nr:class I SAM-dependent methyltransferase [uncultured Roseibium sp.]